MTTLPPSSSPATSWAARIQSVRSPEGIEAWLIEDHALPILSMSFGLRGGSARDPAGMAGAGRMLLDLLREGAGPLAEDAFRRELGAHGIRLAFGLRPDRVVGQLKTMTRCADRAFALLGLALGEPHLAPRSVEQVRERVTAEVRQDLGRPEVVATRGFFGLGFAGHPYGCPAAGDPETLARITRDDLVALHAGGIGRAGLRVAVVGAVSAEALGPLLDRAFTHLPAGAEPAIEPVALGHLGERAVTRLDRPQATLRFGRPAFPTHDPDFPAALVAVHCLGGMTMTSRLFREVREHRGLCYNVWAQLQALDGAFTLVGGTATGNARAAEALDVIEAEIRRLARDGLDREELERAKGYLIGSDALRLDTGEAIAGRLLDLQFDGRDRTWLDMRNQRIASVTLADSARAIGRLVGDGALLTVIAGNPADL